MSAVRNAVSPLPELSLREKIAQLIFVRIGSNLPPVRTVEEDEERVARLLEECPIGGLLLFNGGPDTKTNARAAASCVEGAAAGGVRHRARRRTAGAGLHAVSACDGARTAGAAASSCLVEATVARSARRRHSHHVRTRGRREHESAQSDHFHSRVQRRR